MVRLSSLDCGSFSSPDKAPGGGGDSWCLVCSLFDLCEGFSLFSSCLAGRMSHPPIWSPATSTSCERQKDGPGELKGAIRPPYLLIETPTSPYSEPGVKSKGGCSAPSGLHRLLPGPAAGSRRSRCRELGEISCTSSCGLLLGAGGPFPTGTVEMGSAAQAPTTYLQYLPFPKVSPTSPYSLWLQHCASQAGSSKNMA